MKTTISEQNGLMTVTFIGGLDTVASNQVERDLAPLFKRDDCDVMLNCAELKFISSSGLRLLLNIYKHVRNNGHSLSLTGLQSGTELYDALDLAGLFQLFNLKK